MNRVLSECSGHAGHERLRNAAPVEDARAFSGPPYGARCVSITCGRPPNGAALWRVSVRPSHRNTVRCTARREIFTFVTLPKGGKRCRRTRFRHGARFVRWRPDKRPEDCRYDQLEVTPAYELERVFGARDLRGGALKPRHGS